MRYTEHSEPFPVKERNDCHFPEQALGFVGLLKASQRTTNPARNTLAEALGHTSQTGMPAQAAAVLPGAQSKYQQLGTDNSCRSRREAYHK